MPNPATTADLAARWRPLGADEDAVGATLLDDAWRMLKRAVVNVEAGIDADADYSDEAVRVLASAVLRVLKNPEGKRQESVDDYSYTRDSTQATGTLYFTSEELGALASTRRTRAFSFSVLPVGYPDATFAVE